MIVHIIVHVLLGDPGLCKCTLLRMVCIHNGTKYRNNPMMKHIIIETNGFRNNRIHTSHVLGGEPSLINVQYKIRMI